MASNILGDLANAAKALSAHRYGVTTAGNNLANVNNPDYARQRVVLGENGVTQTMFGPQGTGVEVQGFQHMRDLVLDREVMRETSINASLEAQKAAISKAEANMGQEIDRTGDSPFVDGSTSNGGGSGGVAETLSNLFNAFHSLSANPSSDAESESLLQKAEILTEKLNVTAERFTNLKEDIGLQIETDLEGANRLIKEIARVNTEIARAEGNHPGQALGLRDQRQSLLEQLSKVIQIKTENVDDSGGQIRVYIPTVGGDNPQIDLVNRGRFEQIELDDGDSPVFSIVEKDVQISIRGGSIHGALEARDGSIAKYERGLDDLAKQLVTKINDLYSPTGSNFFADTGDPAQLTAAGISLDSGLNSTTLKTGISSNAGDNGVVLAIAELADSAHAELGDRTFGSFYRSVVTDLGESSANVNSRLADENIVFRLLKEQRDSVSGVSIDEEMTDMMKFQRAYEATGKVIRAIDEMLDVIVNGLV